MPFTATWSALQAQLSSGAAIANWSVSSGALGDSFSITKVAPTFVEVDAPGAQTIQHITSAEFEKVYKLWPAYLASQIRRDQVRDATRFSKYIISIFHWLEGALGSALP